MSRVARPPTTWFFRFLLLCMATAATAQVSTATVTGVVDDSRGARIAAATIKLINSQTGNENDTTTSQYGLFLLPEIIPGFYTLQIQRDGFATVQITRLTLNVGDTKSVLIRMNVGLVSQTVHVDGSGIVPNLADASVSTVVDRRFVANVPLNGRSFQDLISMTPGVVSQTPQSAGTPFSAQGDFSVNGQRPDTNSYTVDGISADIGIPKLAGHQKAISSGTTSGTTALGTTQSIVSLDALQEFRVLTSNYSAEYGNTSGGQFTLLTRSGSDAAHGSLYDYVRNNDADAADWFRGFNHAMVASPYHQQDFGGSLGAPLIIPKLYNGKDHTFAFASYEGLRVSQPSASLIEWVPTQQIRLAAPPAIQPVLNSFPVGYGSVDHSSPAATGLTPFSPGSLSAPSDIDSTSMRLDHVFSPRLSAFLRYGYTPSHSSNQLLSTSTDTSATLQTLTLGGTAQLSPKLTNEVRFGLAKNQSTLNATVQTGFPENNPPDFNSILGLPPSASGTVFIDVPGAGATSIGTDSASANVHQWELRDTMTAQVAHHPLRFGIDQRHLVSTLRPPAISVEADFLSKDAMVGNNASDIAITRYEPATANFEQFAAFMQDEWHVSKSLTLSPGLRWDIDPPPHGSHGADAYTVLGNLASPDSLILAPRGTSLWNTDWLDVAPRLGLAWNADSHTGRELVLRAGGGVFYDTDNRAAAGAFSALGFSATQHPENDPIPISPAQLDFSTIPRAPYTNTTVFAFPRHLRTPYAIQWNISIERALGRNQTFTASYVGANGRRLLRERRVDIHNQNAQFGEIYTFPGGVTSNYNALQMKFQRSVAPGLQALLAYSWSHSLDYGSVDPAWPLSYGNSDLDVRHNVEAAISWEEPRLSASGYRRYLFTGWGADGRLTARSAFPVTPLGNLYSDPATGNRYFSGVNLIAGRPLYIYGSQYPGGRMFNGGPGAVSPAFGPPAPGSPGNAPRNMLRGFGDYQINAAIRREIPFGDRAGLQIRAEIYNLFNHPNLGYIDPSLTDALFGQSTLMLNQSFGPTGSLYEPGGPRSIQLSARMHF